jgi:AI-2 transport protein TqsA
VVATGRLRGPQTVRQWGIPRGVIVLVGLAAAVVAAGGVKVMAWLIGPTFLALVIVIAISPVQEWMRRRGLPGWSATLALVLGVYAVLIVMVLVLVVSVAQLATQLPQYADRAQQQVASATSALSRFGVGEEQLQALAGSLDWGRIAGWVGSLLSGLAGTIANLVFLLALLLFLGFEASTVGARLLAIGRDRPDAAAALAGFAVGTRKYLIATTVFGLIVAVLDTAALMIIGVPLAFTWGLLSFITNYIPNVGFVLGLIPPAVLGLLEGGPTMMIAVIVLYSVLNFVIQSLIQPRFVGDSVGLSATVTFLALLFWTWLIGPLGAILAIPLTLLAKALLVDIDPGARWADALLRNRPADPGRSELTTSGTLGQTY